MSHENKTKLLKKTDIFMRVLKILEFSVIKSVV